MFPVTGAIGAMVSVEVTVFDVPTEEVDAGEVERRLVDFLDGLRTGEPGQGSRNGRTPE